MASQAIDRRTELARLRQQAGGEPLAFSLRSCGWSCLGCAVDVYAHPHRWRDRCFLVRERRVGRASGGRRAR